MGFALTFDVPEVLHNAPLELQFSVARFKSPAMRFNWQLETGKLVTVTETCFLTTTPITFFEHCTTPLAIPTPLPVVS
jgi:hypothetical protein